MTFQNQGGMGQPDAQGGLTYGQRADTAVQGAFLTQAFFWMFAGLMVSAAVAAFAQYNEALLSFTGRNFFILIIAQLALAIGIQWGISRIPATIALGLFFVYAAHLNPDEAPKRFERFDADKDGVLSRDEFIFMGAPPQAN